MIPICAKYKEDVIMKLRIDGHEIEAVAGKSLLDLLREL